MTSPRSQRFGNRWDAVVESRSGRDEESVRETIDYIHEDLHETWAELEALVKSPSCVKNERLVNHQPPRKRLDEDESRRQRAHRQFLERRRPLSIVDVLMYVHESTGMLNAFQMPPSARHQLSSDQRLRLSLAVILARGMNVGIAQMSTLLGRWYTIGRLTNFDEGYMTVRNLQEANRILLDVWDERNLGRTWGRGQGVAADGRSIAASERTLLAGYHFRHRRSGVTLYWLVRDDWMAARVGVIGNHEWESWYLLDGILAPVGGHLPDWATGDTHGQHLALWGLSCLMGKEIRARFRRLSHVKLYNDDPQNALPLIDVQRINWKIVDRAIPSLTRLVAAIRNGQLSAKDVLRTWNIIDEQGLNVTEALRELGKAERTKFILQYAMDESMRVEIQSACNRIESWNSFQQALFWGHGGRLRATDPARQEIDALCMQLLMNAIVFYNAERFGRILKNIEGSCPVIWEHIRMLGDYRITMSRRKVTGSPSE